MGMKKNDTTFGFLTRNMSESIDLCLILFAFLISKKNAFENSDMALPLTKYRDFFKTLYDLSLFKETRFDGDAKYKNLISAVINDDESDSLKDESYFFNDLEKVVKIHNKDSQKQIIHVLFPLSCIMFIVGVIYIFVFCRNWAFTKAISLYEIILEGMPAIIISGLGMFFLLKCIISLKVISGREKNPIKRYLYHDIDIDYCFRILNSEIKQVYNEINTSHYTKDLIIQLNVITRQNVVNEVQDNNILRSIYEVKEKIRNLDELLNTISEIDRKASSIEELSNNIELLINPTEDSKLIDDFISYGAPLKKTPKGVRCAGSTNSLVHWIIEGNYDDPGRVDWILENVKDKNGKRMNRETLLEYFRDNREIYRTNKNLK